jgi:hypothetical protein
MKIRYSLQQFQRDSGQQSADFSRFQSENPGWTWSDTLEDQLRELYAIRHPGPPSKDEAGWKQWRAEIEKQDPAAVSGTWVLYPWLRTGVRLLNEELFIEVRTARNRYKITAEEQLVLRSKAVGVMGLSIGSAVAMTLVMERTCGTLRVADFDTLGLSNLNRLRGGVHELGLPKYEVFARAALEQDPYLNIEVFPGALDASNLAEFLTGLDLVVELTDTIRLKLLTRVEARRFRLPVLMDTNERGLLDVERYDLEPNRPYFHGIVPEEWITGFDTLAPSEQQELLLRLVSFREGSKRGQHSFMEVGKSINSWPQLASAVMVGAGATVDVARKILLGLTSVSGRFYVDLDAFIPEEIHE